MLSWVLIFVNHRLLLSVAEETVIEEAVVKLGNMMSLIQRKKANKLTLFAPVSSSFLNLYS